MNPILLILIILYLVIVLSKNVLSNKEISQELPLIIANHYIIYTRIFRGYFYYHFYYVIFDCIFCSNWNRFKCKNEKTY